MAQRKRETKKTQRNGQSVEFDDDNAPEPVHISKTDLSAAVVFNTDWTAETVTTQTSNISLTPNFQRRDAWSVEKKSRFIESLIIGLPVPPIVLAEQQGHRGKFIVIDGKQRLLSILQFWGKNEESPNNSYALRGLDVRDDLSGLTFNVLSTKAKHADDYVALQNQTIRTIVIRNWPSDDFLHLVFLRLNTASVRLSSQELRQALKPGPYTSRVDTYAADDPYLRRLLGSDNPDPRMRDTEILGRHVAFALGIETYPGRLKNFVDASFQSLNDTWGASEAEVEKTFKQFDEALESLFTVFGEKELARRPGSRLLNKALLDPLLYYFSRTDVRRQAAKHSSALRKEYLNLFNDEKFAASIALDTASTDGTVYRFSAIGRTLSRTCGLTLKVPARARTGSSIVLK